MLFLVHGVPPPLLNTTSFWYVIHYHVLHLSCNGSCVSRGGGAASYKKKCKIVYSPIKKYPDIDKNLDEQDWLYISSPDTTKCDVSFTQWMQNLIKMRRLKHLSKDWGTMPAKSLNVLCKLYELRLAKYHWWGFSTRNAHMVHIINCIRFKIMYAS